MPARVPRRLPHLHSDHPEQFAALRATLEQPVSERPAQVLGQLRLLLAALQDGYRPDPAALQALESRMARMWVVGPEDEDWRARERVALGAAFDSARAGREVEERFIRVVDADGEKHARPTEAAIAQDHDRRRAAAHTRLERMSAGEWADWLDHLARR